MALLHPHTARPLDIGNHNLIPRIMLLAYVAYEQSAVKPQHPLRISSWASVAIAAVDEKTAASTESDEFLKRRFYKKWPKVNYESDTEKIKRGPTLHTLILTLMYTHENRVVCPHTCCACSHFYVNWLRARGLKLLIRHGYLADNLIKAPVAIKHRWVRDINIQTGFNLGKERRNKVLSSQEGVNGLSMPTLVI